MNQSGELDHSMTSNGIRPAMGASVDQTLEQWCQLMRGLQALKIGQSRPWGEVQVTLPQLRVLGLLASRPEGRSGLSGRELAARLGVGPSAVTPVVDRLVEHGLVRREEDRFDRRITRLHATEEGLALLERMFAGQREVLVSLFNQLNRDELALVERALGVLRQGLQRLADESPEAVAAS
jgi:DNA-binding MarR family transcriptional regulator